MAVYRIAGETLGSTKIRIFTEPDNEYIGYKDVSSGSYEIKFRLNSEQEVFAAGEVASGESRAYGKVTPTTSSGIPTIVQPEDWDEKTGAFDASNSDRLLLDSSGGPFTVNLPASPVMGDAVSFVDAAASCGTNNVTVGRNGEKIMGLEENLTIDEDDAAFDLVYYNSTYGWRIRYE